MKNNFIDDNEKKDLEIWDSVDISRSKSDVKNIKHLRSAAKDYIKKHETKMNIRISQDELDLIKQRAQREGLRYQTFIKSILHKYMTGQLVENNAKAIS